MERETPRPNIALIRSLLDDIEELQRSLARKTEHLRAALEKFPDDWAPSATKAQPEVMTARELAAHFKVSQATIVRLCLRSEEPMPSTFVGNARRFNVRVCEEWRARQERRPASDQVQEDRIDVSSIMKKAGFRMVRR